MKTSTLRPTKFLGLTLLLLLSALRCDSSATPGDVDLSFDPGPGINGTVTALALQADGKVIIGGAFTMVKGLARSGIARLHADGSGDATFNAGLAVERNVSAIVLQSDGKVIVTRCVPVISGPGPGLNYPPVRLNSDGTVDDTFIPTTESHLYGSGFSCVLIQPNGTVVLGGYFIEYYVDGEGFIYYYQRSLLIRLNANGTADPSFAFASGDFGTWIGSVALQADGKVLIGGRFFTVNGTNRNGIARLDANGSLDRSFNPGTGVGIYPNWVNSIAVQADGRVLVGGWFSSVNGTNRNGIARLNANGSLDGSFNPGTGANGNVASLALQPDGKVFIGGDFTTVNGTSRNRIARLNFNGSLDSNFDPGTGVDGSVRSVALQSDGKVFIGGNFLTVNGVARPYVARLHGDSSTPPSFTTWAAGFGFSGGDAAADADPDRDGLANAVEYVLGSNPSQPSSAARPAITLGGGNMVFTFLRLDGSETPDATLSVEASTDLLIWPAVFTIGATTPASSPGVTVVENGGAPDTITVAIALDNHSRLFARLRVTVAE